MFSVRRNDKCSWDGYPKYSVLIITHFICVILHAPHKYARILCINKNEINFKMCYGFHMVYYLLGCSLLQPGQHAVRKPSHVSHPGLPRILSPQT